MRVAFALTTLSGSLKGFNAINAIKGLKAAAASVRDNWLTAKTALMFEVALDVPADSLMYLQMKYNMQTTRNDKSFLSVLKGVKKVAAGL